VRFKLEEIDAIARNAEDGAKTGASGAALAPIRRMVKPDNGGEIMTETATFGAGCFWGVEAAFRNVEGVKATAVGYSGGTTENPTYEEVCTDRTGHAEVVRVEYDPEKVSYEQLLDVFWKCHDPTQLNRQGPDYGKQYRSVVFSHTPEQEKAARASKERLEASDRFKGRKIVTQIEPAPEFYMAEPYHQQYLQKRGQASCHLPLGE
jgi:peptide-methionine (S)-S-oxide reductase